MSVSIWHISLYIGEELIYAEDYASMEHLEERAIAIIITFFFDAIILLT